MKALLALLVLTLIAGCTTPVIEEDTDSEAIGEIAEPLSSFSCKASKATGYRSGHPYKIVVVRVDGKRVERSTANAYYTMASAAAKSGVQLRVVSGFRTMKEQKHLYSCYVNCSCNGCNLAAKPGYSNHQSGLALDLNTSSGGVYGWLSKHAGKYGFKRTVPSEAWHWEYLGKRPVAGRCGKQTSKKYKTVDAPDFEDDGSGEMLDDIADGDDAAIEAEEEHAEHEAPVEEIDPAAAEPAASCTIATPLGQASRAALALALAAALGLSLRRRQS
jgi:hypothetical protein